MIPRIPKWLANQQVIFKLVNQKDVDPRHGTPIQHDPVTINHCVMQLGTVYSGTNNNRQIVANGLLIFYAGITDPMPDIDVKNSLQSKVTYEGTEYTVTNITELKQPNLDQLWGYELEVL